MTSSPTCSTTCISVGLNRFLVTAMDTPVALSAYAALPQDVSRI